MTRRAETPGAEKNWQTRFASELAKKGPLGNIIQQMGEGTILRINTVHLVCEVRVMTEGDTIMNSGWSHESTMLVVERVNGRGGSSSKPRKRPVHGTAGKVIGG